MRQIDFNPDDLEGIIETMIGEFSRGRPVILPTDTIHGLAAPVDNEEAIRSIFEIKERPPEMTLPVAVGDLESISLVAFPTEDMMYIVTNKLPGPFTFVLPSGGGLSNLLERNGTVAVRIPDHILFGPLCRRAGPLALTSANLHDLPPVNDIGEAKEQFGDLDILVIIDERLGSDIPSEIIDLTGGEPIILRKGNTLTRNEKRP